MSILTTEHSDKLKFQIMLDKMKSGLTNILLCYYSNLRANDPELCSKVRAIVAANVHKFTNEEVRNQIELIKYCTDDQLHIVVPKLYPNLVYVNGAASGNMSSDQIKFLARRSARNDRKRIRHA